MARKRMENPEIKEWEEVDISLRKIREAQIEIAKINADMEKCIIDVKQKAEEAVFPLQTEIKKLELQIKEFVTLNRNELDGKSKAMTFGTVGFRKSTKIAIPKPVDKLIKQLRKLGMGDCVIVKETVDKNVLKSYDENTLIMVGCMLKTEDTFWYETKQEELPATN